MARFTNDQWTQFIAAFKWMADEDVALAAQCLLMEFHRRTVIPIVFLKAHEAPMVTISLLGAAVTDEQRWIDDLLSRHTCDDRTED